MQVDEYSIESLPAWLQNDPLSRMRAYRIATKLQQQAWDDAEKLKKNSITAEVAGQLYTAVGSIAANLAEGYSRSSGKDRVRIFEYALGSAREAMAWYVSGAPVIGDETTTKRGNALEEIRRIMLTAIPAERNRLIPRLLPRDSLSARSPQVIRSPKTAVRPQAAVRSSVPQTEVRSYLGLLRTTANYCELLRIPADPLTPQMRYRFPARVASPRMRSYPWL